MYVSPNFPTKKSLKEAIANGKPVYVFQPNDMFNIKVSNLKNVCVEGPHYPKPHTWYGQVDTDNDGKVVKVK